MGSDVKSQAMQIDEQCLRTTHKQWHTAVQASPPSIKLPPVTTNGFSGTNSSNEESRQNDTMKRNQLAMEQERNAQTLREESAAIIDHCEQTCAMAKSRTERTMQERISENQSMRKRLEQEIRGTNAKIDRVK